MPPILLNCAFAWIGNCSIGWSTEPGAGAYRVREELCAGRGSDPEHRKQVVRINYHHVVIGLTVQVKSISYRNKISFNIKKINKKIWTKINKIVFLDNGIGVVVCTFSSNEETSLKGFHNWSSSVVSVWHSPRNSVSAASDACGTFHKITALSMTRFDPWSGAFTGVAR